MDNDSVPAFDYPNWPYAPRQGIQSEGNQKYMTKSLFVETCPNNVIHRALYVLGEHELYIPDQGQWLPSAWLIYIYAKDEYDAMRKLVGNPHQWETLKNSPWFGKWLEQWEAERQMLVASQIKSELRAIISSGKGGAVSAAKELANLEGVSKPVGRPKKDIQPARSSEEEVEEDAARLKLVSGSPS